MKNPLLLTIILIMMACSQDSAQYKGILPAADCSGIGYSLSLDSDSRRYSLETTYIDADGPGRDVTFRSTGRVEIICNAADSGEYYRLSPENGTDTVCFKRIDRRTLRLVNADFQEPSVPENYDITRQ